MTEAIEFRSGTWTGFYQQARRQHRMDLELTFDGGVLRGGGWDEIGEFRIKGSYDDATGEVRWTKRYVERHAVYYRGFREGKGIWGTWQIPGQDHAGFQIWPLGEGDA